MTFQPGATLYTQGFGSRPENVEVPHIDVRAPASSDYLYPVGKKWVDTIHNATYELTSLSVSAGVTSANWVAAAGGSVELSSLSDTLNNKATPSGGNIQIAGTANEITTAASGSVVTLSLPSAVVLPGSISTTHLLVTTGANTTLGTSAAMTAGTITISTTAVTASSKIFLTANTLAGTPGTLSAPTASITAGTSFVITSSSNTDTSTVNWWIIN